MKHFRPHSTVPGPRHVQPTDGSTTLDDGSMVVTVDQLARFGGGDAREGRRELRLMLSMERNGPVFNGPTVRPKNVRLAGPKDEEAILALYLGDLQANAAHIAPIDEMKCLELIRCGTRRRGGFVGVIDEGDKPVAMVILVPQCWHWSNGYFLQELSLYVHPDHRGTRYAHDLMNWSKWVSDSMSASWGSRCYLLAGVLGGWRVRAKIALYRRMFPVAGCVSVYPAPPAMGN